MTVASTLLPSSFAIMLISRIAHRALDCDDRRNPRAGNQASHIRVNPPSSVDCADEDPNCGTLVLANQPPGARDEFPAKEIVYAGFLELVRLAAFAVQTILYKDRSASL